MGHGEDRSVSWVVTRRIDGEVVGEFFSREIVAKIDPEKYLVETTERYLARINRELRSAR